jgi:methionine-rich copper-binding protein CopC
MLSRKFAVSVALLLGLTAAWTVPVLAHASLVQSDPAANSAGPAPKSFTLTFNEKVSPAFSGFEVSMGAGMDVKVTTKISDDGKTITGMPMGPFMRGTYKLSWHAAAVDDGHRTEGSFTFQVK